MYIHMDYSAPCCSMVLPGAPWCSVVLPGAPRYSCCSQLNAIWTYGCLPYLLTHHTYGISWDRRENGASTSFCYYTYGINVIVHALLTYYNILTYHTILTMLYILYIWDIEAEESNSQGRCRSRFHQSAP